ncbi:hypothetical protein OEZ86_009098 [Tetradesmus obliquus]|uniref:YegS/DAGK C-terminal domain-containing protein n=1 Tax=Tetradesmus obliquus TaxID=3088 RepID=A0ABY8UMG8_TETOB|nr:hypothetical protein OEZ85_000673 [Tetradesmus obliquus]WIA41762.1 hypothetical protein OEZ86_009098 [Tetradesmus obliquus]
MEASEKLRWMGPLRYDVAGALRFLLLKGYDATVCGKSRSGVCPEAHLADGRLVLVLVEKKGRLAYLRFLLQLATQGVVPGALPFVRVEHVTEVQVHARGKQSSWNVDGELLRHPRVHIGVHAGLVDVFARGIEQM